MSCLHQVIFVVITLIVILVVLYKWLKIFFGATISQKQVSFVDLKKW